jgi:hypothetical protein
MAIRGRLSRFHQTQRTPKSVAPRLPSRLLILGGAATILALVGTIGLWAFVGATVFFETIRVGFVACFG